MAPELHKISDQIVRRLRAAWHVFHFEKPESFGRESFGKTGEAVLNTQHSERQVSSKELAFASQRAPSRYLQLELFFTPLCKHMASYNCLKLESKIARTPRASEAFGGGMWGTCP